MQPAVLAALVTGLLSLVVSVWNYISTRRNQQQLEALRQQNAIELEQVRAELQSGKAVEDARRSYEFDARKRLYTQVEPLLFQLTGAAESAYVRITDVARAARHGQLDGPNGWLSGDNDYFLLSTLHRLTVPLSLIRVWQRELTLVDLNLDSVIRVKFAAARQLTLSWSEDFALAQSDPPIAYDPPHDRRQGLYIGEVERLADSLIFGGDVDRVMSFGQFEAEYRRAEPSFRAAVGPLADVLIGFHPQRQPVTWRILIAQAHLYRLLTNLKRGAADGSIAIDQPAFVLPPDDRRDFDWRSEQGDVSDEVCWAPFSATEMRVLPQLRRTIELYST